jgi:CO/xanthine dehydrogenase Mo-binding subunit
MKVAILEHKLFGGTCVNTGSAPTKTMVKGQPKDTNLDTYRVLRMGDLPALEIEFLPSTVALVGLGEPATPAVAPAIGNAIFAACGARVRHSHTARSRTGHARRPGMT